jgi:DNA sulfur modification protein DndD
MQLDRLVLRDVGVFRGINTFELTPRKKYGSVRPVVLFGGLNGAGKTTFLLSVRIALYGRLAFGTEVSAKDYHEALRELIHRNSEAEVKNANAEVALQFTYVQSGQSTCYSVTRSWRETGKSIEEALRVERNGEPIPGLTQDQAQAFLTTLVPQGVSQFFFFDGEKIATLAEMKSDEPLAEAVSKLLGLDVVSRLKTDIALLLRQKRQQDAGSGAHEHAEVEAEISRLEGEVRADLERLKTETQPRLDEEKVRLDRAKARLSEGGGAWAINRTELERRMDALVEKRGQVESEIGVALSGAVPFALAPRLTQAASNSIEGEVMGARARLATEALRTKLNELETALLRAIPKTYENPIKDVLGKFSTDSEAVAKGSNPSNLRLGESDLLRLQRLLSQEAAEGVSVLRRLRGELQAIDAEISDLRDSLATAPSEAALADLFKDLEESSKEVGRLEQEKRAFIEEIRRKVWANIDLVRKIRRIEFAISGKQTQDLVYKRGEALLELLDQYAAKSVEAKMVVLRRHFVSAFTRLARKKDFVFDVLIDPKTFAVELVGRGGKRIPKGRLSAGEKQIYAIAMLEALGRTSGRNLPVIIDTPLGRLDSRHRGKLIDSYFPTASHQVVILSTDTEVDRAFYDSLSKHISHAYHLNFDEDLGHTVISEGYFWKGRDAEVSIAA